jgi:hypothetical protein
MAMECISHGTELHSRITDPSDNLTPCEKQFQPEINSCASRALTRNLNMF